MPTETVNFDQHPLAPGEAVPFFIAPGVLKEPSHLTPFIEVEDRLMVPLLVLGGFTLGAWAGRAQPGEVDHVYYQGRRAMGNARDFPNPGQEGIRALKEPIKKLTDKGAQTIIQITSLAHEDPLDVIPELAEIAVASKPTAVEVNLSCPNGVGKKGRFAPPLYHYPDLSEEVLYETRQRIGNEVTLTIKDGPHTPSLDVAVDRYSVQRFVEAVRPYIDAVTGINSIADQPFPEITCADGRGGMSGPIIAPIAKQHLGYWRELAPEVAYLSCGGIDSENIEIEAPERLAAGALRVGGAQEFYRTRQPHLLVERWAQAL